MPIAFAVLITTAQHLVTQNSHTACGRYSIFIVAQDYSDRTNWRLFSISSSLADLTGNVA